MAEAIRGKRRKQANPRRNQVDVEKLNALGSEGEDEGAPWGAESHDIQDKNSLTASEGTEPGSPAHCANPQSLSPAHGWTGGPLNTSAPGEREWDRGELIYSQEDHPGGLEDLAHYDFLMQLRQAPNPGPRLERHAHNGTAGAYHPALPAREETRPPCWSPGVHGSPEGQEAPPTSPDALLACPFCQRTYRRDGALREHVRFCQERDSRGRLVCPLCGYIAPYRAQMERHAAMHSLEDSKHPTMYDQAMEDRKFKCLQCGKAFKYKHHLKEHLRIHSGEKPYECANCKKRFSHSGSYSSHLSSKKCLGGGGGGGSGVGGAGGGPLNGQVYATYLSGSSPGSPPAGKGRNSGKGSPYAFQSPAGQREQALLEGSRLVQSQEFAGLWDPASELYRSDLFKGAALFPYLHSGDKFGHVLQEMLRRGGVHGEEGVTGGTEGGAKGEGPVGRAEPAGGGVTCGWCSQLFPSRAVLIQHERYLCRMNRDAVEVLEAPSQGRAKDLSRASSLQAHHAHKANGFGRERSPIRRSSWPPLPQRSPLLPHPDSLGPRPLWPTQEAGSPARHPGSPASPSFLERRHGTPRGFGSPLCLDLSAHAHAPVSSPPSRPTPPCGTPSSAGSQNEPLDLSLPKPRWDTGDDRPCNGRSPPGDRRAAPPLPQQPGPYGGTPLFRGPVYSAFPLFNPIMPTGPLGGPAHQESLSPLSLNHPAHNNAPFLPPVTYMLESDTEAFLKRVHQERQTLMFQSEAMSRGCLDYLSLMEDGAEGECGAGRKRLKKTDEGLYACDICDKTFQKSSSLLRHKYEHTGKRPHECNICKKAFKHKHHLIEHSRLHSGEKPYQCDKCGKRFSHSGSYSQHMNHRYAYCGRDQDPDTPGDDLPPLGVSLGLELEGVGQGAGLGGASFLSDSSLDGGLREEEEEEEDQRGVEPGAGGALTDRLPLTRGGEASSEDGSGAELGAEHEAGGMAEGGLQMGRVQERDDGERGTG